MKKKICVLMSTYNGAAFLEQQIISILSQYHVDVELLIRDDGSTDATPKILAEIEKTNPLNVKVCYGKNIGIQQSFFKLVEWGTERTNCYFAFSDQDDYWKSEKLYKAVEVLTTFSEDMPVVYCSNLTIANSDLHEIGLVYKNDQIQIQKKGSMIRNYAYGCTSVFNAKAAALFLKGQNSRMWMHDFWLSLIGIYIGAIVFDPQSYILYRQHSNNSVGIKHSFTQTIERKKKAFKKRKEHPRENMMRDFLEIYAPLLSEEDKKTIEDFLSYRNSLGNRLKAATDREYWKYKGITQFFLVIRFLIGNV